MQTSIMNMMAIRKLARATGWLNASAVRHSTTLAKVPGTIDSMKARKKPVTAQARA